MVAITMTPLKGCGMWSGVLLSKFLRLPKHSSYPLLIVGSILGCLLVFGLFWMFWLVLLLWWVEWLMLFDLVETLGSSVVKIGTMLERLAFLLLLAKATK